MTTDFGTRDPWVASVKGILWQANPEIRICDVSHEIPKHDIISGAFTLYRCYKDFPQWTIHMAVVDPGVGGSRRPILVITDGYYFVGPDNGIFSYIYATGEVERVIHITADHYFRKPVSGTFHARDVFAPIVGWLSKGIETSSFGEVIEDYEKPAVPMDRIVGDNLLKGEVCAIDRFGNLITNIRLSMLKQLSQKTGKTRFKVLISGRELQILTGGYQQKVDVFALVNSSNLVEISAASQPAAEVLGITVRGKEVGVMGDG
jgi:S-adenosylmethionine hydrolase